MYYDKRAINTSTQEVKPSINIIVLLFLNVRSTLFVIYNLAWVRLSEHNANHLLENKSASVYQCSVTWILIYVEFADRCCYLALKNKSS